MVKGSNQRLMWRQREAQFSRCKQQALVPKASLECGGGFSWHVATGLRRMPLSIEGVRIPKAALRQSGVSVDQVPQWGSRSQVLTKGSIDHRDGSRGCVEVVKQARVDADPASRAIPFSVRFECRAVAINGTAAGRAKVMRDELGVPTVDAIAGSRDSKLTRLVLCNQRAAARTK